MLAQVIPLTSRISKSWARIQRMAAPSLFSTATTWANERGERHICPRGEMRWHGCDGPLRGYDDCLEIDAFLWIGT